MIVSHETAIAAGREEKRELLASIYSVYSRWVERFPLACQKGCAACCTQSVVITSLEGEVILDAVKDMEAGERLLAKLFQARPGRSRIAITTNQFADACIRQQEVDGETSGGWDFTDCVFLERKTCSIYGQRPFGCRSFGSLVRCTADSSAEIAPIHLSINTVFTQIIEHLNSDGGYCASMIDMLHSLSGRGENSSNLHLLQARPLPGFLLEPHEMRLAKSLLQELYVESGGKRIFGDLIDNFMPIE